LIFLGADRQRSEPSARGQRGETINHVARSINPMLEAQRKMQHNLLDQQGQASGNLLGGLSTGELKFQGILSQLTKNPH
jgi:hypothetical protein